MAVLEGRCWAAGGGAAALGLCECELIFDLEAARTSCRLGRNFTSAQTLRVKLVDLFVTNARPGE